MASSSKVATINSKSAPCNSKPVGKMNTNVVDYYAHLSLEDSEEGHMIVRKEVLAERREDHCLVGRFISNKPMNANNMKNTFASL